MATPRISCAPQPSPSRHNRSRSKDAEAVQSRGRVGRSGREGFTHLFYTDKSLHSRIAMGALDGGLDLPHSDRRFAGFKKDKKQLGAEIHLKYIYEGHVADYMKALLSKCRTLSHSPSMTIFLVALLVPQKLFRKVIKLILMPTSVEVLVLVITDFLKHNNLLPQLWNDHGFFAFLYFHMINNFMANLGNKQTSLALANAFPLNALLAECNFVLL
ncbi:unnamed protein product [Triticum turgidum subsp. durum]|uniref:60S ribosomal protein L5-2 n=1 Tax=Triticum turgidum subsp. durum TaxID=4567 RepID=A0A9R0S2Y4_TRITD|nr:unnamed protein product [Triticum turgidum subsp. durum]